MCARSIPLSILEFMGGQAATRLTGRLIFRRGVLRYAPTRRGKQRAYIKNLETKINPVRP
jgi:hypothetical protein